MTTKQTFEQKAMEAGQTFGKAFESLANWLGSTEAAYAVVWRNGQGRINKIREQCGNGAVSVWFRFGEEALPRSAASLRDAGRKIGLVVTKLDKVVATGSIYGDGYDAQNPVAVWSADNVPLQRRDMNEVLHGIEDAWK